MTRSYLADRVVRAETIRHPQILRYRRHDEGCHLAGHRRAGFHHPGSILQAGIRSLQPARPTTPPTPAVLELRQALAEHLQRLYGVHYDPVNEIDHHRGRLRGALPGA